MEKNDVYKKDDKAFIFFSALCVVIIVNIGRR